MKRAVLVFAAVLVLLAMPGLSSAARNNHYDAALKAYYSGHYTKAVSDLKEYVRERPEPAAYYLIGYGLYKLRKYKEATEYFDQAYLIDPTFSPEKIGFGKFATEMKRKRPARAAVRRKKEAAKKAPVAKAAVTRAAAKPVKPETAAPAARPPSPIPHKPVPPKVTPKARATAPPKAVRKAPVPPRPHRVTPERARPRPSSAPAHSGLIFGMAPALLAGLLAVFVLLILVLAIVLYRRRAKKRREDVDTFEDSDEDSGPEPPDFFEDE